MCEKCGKTYKIVNNKTWNDQKAAEEFVNTFPEAIDHSVSILCDDCYKSFTQWFLALPPEEKEHMRNSGD